MTNDFYDAQFYGFGDEDRQAEEPTAADLRAELAATRIKLADAERALGAAQSEHVDLVSRLGFGNNITEPMADNDTVVKWFEQESRDASEWRESQRWRDDCYQLGHSELDDCFECDPLLRLQRQLAAARLALGACREVREARD